MEIDNVEFARNFHKLFQANRLLKHPNFSFVKSVELPVIYTGNEYRFLHAIPAIAVKPAWTSQDCSACSTRVKKSLSVRTHTCSGYGMVLDRNQNIAIMRRFGSCKILLRRERLRIRPSAQPIYSEFRSFAQYYPTGERSALVEQPEMDHGTILSKDLGNETENDREKGSQEVRSYLGSRWKSPQRTSSHYSTRRKESAHRQMGWHSTQEKIHAILVEPRISCALSISQKELDKLARREL